MEVYERERLTQKRELNFDRLHELLKYEDGYLYARKSRKRVAAGKKVGSYSQRYACVTVDGNQQLMHRVIFFMHNYYLPKYIDHIDGNRFNNKIENLRPCTFSQNINNQGLRSSNTSGFKGLKRVGEKWYSFITLKRHKIYLGSFETKEDAARAYDKKAKEVHGIFAKLNFPEGT